LSCPSQISNWHCALAGDNFLQIARDFRNGQENACIGCDPRAEQLWNRPKPGRRLDPVEGGGGTYKR